MTEQNEPVIDGQSLRFHALRFLVFESIRDSLNREGWKTEDFYGRPPIFVDFEGHKIRISVDLCEYREGIGPKDPALLAAKEQLKERRSAA